MICNNCNAQIPDDSGFCPNCGTAVGAVQPQPAEQPAYQQPAEQPAYQQPTYSQPQNYYSDPRPTITSEDDLPEEYRPLSPGAYFGLQILYCIPIVGFIFLIVFSFSNSNINRRNFTRSYWIPIIIGLAISIIYFVIMLFFAAGVSSSFYGY